MSDERVTLQELKDEMAAFVKEREWNKFHSPKNLSMAIAGEAAELMEKFLWMENQESFDELDKNRQEIEDELADVLIAAICFANASNIDLGKAIAQKIEEVKAKYPVEKSRGRYTKYTKL